jgi:hypothetical protein
MEKNMSFGCGSYVKELALANEKLMGSEQIIRGIGGNVNSPFQPTSPKALFNA